MWSMQHARCNLISNFASKVSTLSCRAGLHVAIASTLLVCTAAGAQQAVALDSKQIQQAIANLPTHPPTNREVVTASHYAVKVAVVDHRNGPAELHRSEDRVLYVLHGQAEVCTGGTMKAPRDLSPTEAQAPELVGCTRMPMAPGTVISIPRGVAYQLRSNETRVEFLVVRVEGQ